MNMTSRIKGMKMGMEAEIGETIVIVSPMLSDGFYGFGAKFKAKC